jgi:hypothetical protein
MKDRFTYLALVGCVAALPACVRAIRLLRRCALPLRFRRRTPWAPLDGASLLDTTRRPRRACSPGVSLRRRGRSRLGSPRRRGGRNGRRGRTGQRRRRTRPGGRRRPRRTDLSATPRRRGPGLALPGARRGAGGGRSRRSPRQDLTNGPFPSLAPEPLDLLPSIRHRHADLQARRLARCVRRGNKGSRNAYPLPRLPGGSPFSRPSIDASPRGRAVGQRMRRAFHPDPQAVDPLAPALRDSRGAAGRAPRAPGPVRPRVPHPPPRVPEPLRTTLAPHRSAGERRVTAFSLVFRKPVPLHLLATGPVTRSSRA